MTVSAASALNVTGTDTDARDYTTASWTPVAGKVYLAAIAVLDLGSARDLGNTTVSGNNITWTPVAAGVAGGATEPGLRVWRGYADSSATAGTLTFTGVVTAGNTADGAVWGIVELDGVNPATNNGIVQANTASTATDSVSTTLSAFGSAGNATGAWVVSYDNASTTGPAITAGSGFAIVSGLNAGQAAGGDGLRLAFEFRNDNDTSVDATAVAANDRMLIAAVEIKAALVTTGTASGDASGSGSAVGVRKVLGAAAGAVTASGAASGVRATAGSGAGSAAGSGSATGLRTVLGAAVGGGSASGDASGLRTVFGSGAGGSLSSGSATAGGVPAAPEEERFGGTPYSRRELDRKVWDEQLVRLLREDEELLCLL